MIMVLSMAAVLWGIGAIMKAPYRARWIMLGALIAGVLVEQVVLPDGHPLREATGGDARLWLLILGFAGVIWLYRLGLGGLRRRAEAGRGAVAPADPAKFSQSELDRYSRHILLHDIGGPGQKALKAARVLVVGAGGLGSPVLMYLAASGVGTIGVIDDDVIDPSNLQRQVIHRDGWIGSPKVHSAEMAIREQNPYVTVRPYNRRLTAEIAAELLADYDLVLDGSDNFATRYLVNAACVAAGKPLISAAMTQWEGQIGLYDSARGTACYQCVFPEAPAPGLVPTCSEAGVAGPLPGIIGSIMALEAVKHIVGAGQTLAGRLMIYDGLYADARVMTVSRRAECPVCGTGHTPA